MSDDDETRIIGPGDGDPEATGQLWPPPDQDETVVRTGAATRALPAAEPDPTLRYDGSQRDWLDQAPAPVEPLPSRRSHGGPRPRRSRVPRILAPIVFLAAVLAIFSLTMRAGVLDHGPTAKPQPGHSTTAAPTGGKTTAKVYVVKRGDTLSAIAVKFGTDQQTLIDLNPKMSTTTLTVGEKIKLPPK